MSRPSSGFLAALVELDAALRSLPVPGAVFGGVAAIARGVDRLTRDIDAVVDGAAVSVDAALSSLELHSIVPRISSAREHARRRFVLLLVHAPTGVEIDLSFGFLPFEHEALAAATEVDFEGSRIRVVRAEDLVIFKAVAWRPIDRLDIERLVLLWGREIDLDRVRGWVEQFAEVLDDPERPAELERIVRRAIEG